MLTKALRKKLGLSPSFHPNHKPYFSLEEPQKFLEKKQYFDLSSGDSIQYFNGTITIECLDDYIVSLSMTSNEQIENPNYENEKAKYLKLKKKFEGN